GSGFQTARGRPLAVSAEALAKVEHIFSEAASPGEKNPTFAGPQPPAGTGVSVPEGSEGSVGFSRVREAGRRSSPVGGGNGTLRGGTNSVAGRGAVGQGTGPSSVGISGGGQGVRGG
ncbi:unnamed protein product, partial [Scytosiphon promiscuus]